MKLTSELPRTRGRAETNCIHRPSVVVAQERERSIGRVYKHDQYFLGCCRSALTAPRAISYPTEKGSGNKVCYCRMPWGTTMEFITTPDRMAYHDRTDLRRWQDED